MQRLRKRHLFVSVAVAAGFAVGIGGPADAGLEATTPPAAVQEAPVALEETAPPATTTTVAVTPAAAAPAPAKTAATPATTAAPVTTTTTTIATTTTTAVVESAPADIPVEIGTACVIVRDGPSTGCDS